MTKKLFISADIEGVACISAPIECDHDKPAQYNLFRDQMTAEVAAACAGGFAGGADAILIKDAHYSARNIDPTKLIAPDGKDLRLIRGWSGHPFAMVQELDGSFAAAAFIGYHSAATLGGNPLSHTIAGGTYAQVEINDRIASEFMIYAMAAASVSVPVVFLSGDKALCEDAALLVPGLTTVPILEGHGASTTSITPGEAVRRIEAGVREAMSKAPPPLMTLPQDFRLKIRFMKHTQAYAKSFYPGVRQIDDMTLTLESKSYFDILTFLWFGFQASL
jgi:D-amino peptidase